MKRGEDRRNAIYDFVRDFSERNGYPPTVREICQAVGLRSTSTVHTHLKALQSQGRLMRQEHKTRAVTIAGAPPRGAVPIVGKVTAGQPILAFDDFDGYLPYNTKDGHDYFALRVRGDSMIDAGILDGDYVVVRRQETAEQNEIVVALLLDSGEPEATVKRFRREGKKVWLKPENPNYQPIDGTHSRILGRVRAVVREY